MQTNEPLDDAGCGLAIVRNPEYVFAKTLVSEYRRYHSWADLNPASSPYLKEERWWIIPLYKGFYILIKPGSAAFGPHVAQLRYLSKAWETSFWLATLQVTGLFADTDNLWKQVQSANLSENDSWFISEKAGQVILER